MDITKRLARETSVPNSIPGKGERKGTTTEQNR